MYIVDSWKESFEILKPRFLKVFFLILIKSVIETCKVWFTYFWWLIAIHILFNVALLNQAIYFKIFLRFKNFSYFFSFFYLLFSFLVSFTLILSARPSVKRKTFRYFWDYKFYFLLTILGIVTVYFPLNFFYGEMKDLLMPNILVPKNYIYFKFVKVLLNAIFIYRPIIWVFTLFLLDSKGGLRNLFLSVYRSFKMVIFNYPFYFCVTLALGFFLDAVFLILIYFGLGYMNFYISLLFLPVYLCIFTNFYVKRVHEQFGLYFSE